jgi:hypothetical protein
MQSPGGSAKRPGHVPAPSEQQQADNSTTHPLSLPAESEIQHESVPEIDLNLSHKVLDEHGSVSVPGAGSTLPVELAQNFSASLTNNHISPLRLGKMMTMGPVKSGPRIKESWILKKTCGGSQCPGQKRSISGHHRSDNQKVTIPSGQKVTIPAEQMVTTPFKQKVTIPTNLFSLEGPAAKMARVMGTDTSTEVGFLKESIKKSYPATDDPAPGTEDSFVKKEDEVEEEEIDE